MVAEFAVDAGKHVTTEERIQDGFRQCVYFEFEVNSLIDRMNLMMTHTEIDADLNKPEKESGKDESDVDIELHCIDMVQYL